MSETRVWLGRARRRETEDIRKFIPVLGKVLASTQRPHGIEVERKKARDKKRRMKGLQEATCIPAIALSKGVRKKSSARDHHRESEGSENTPPGRLNKTIPSPPPSPPPPHSPPPPPPSPVYNYTIDEQVTFVAEPIDCSPSSPTDRGGVSVTEAPPTQLNLEEEVPSSWDSIIDGSLPSQLPDKYKMSETSLQAALNCDTDQLLAQLQ